MQTNKLTNQHPHLKQVSYNYKVKLNQTLKNREETTHSFNYNEAKILQRRKTIKTLRYVNLVT